MTAPSRVISSYDRVPWSTFLHEHWRWRQGEHVLVAAPTGVGKTHLIASLLPHSGRRHVAMFVSKTKDPIFSKSNLFGEWHRIREWPPPAYIEKVLLWPQKRRGETLPDLLARQRFVFADAINRIYDELGWCLVFDEQHWFCDPNFLGLAKHNAALQHVGRSAGLTVVNLTQRPAWVPVITYSSASHAFIGHTNDRGDLKRLAELGGVEVKELQHNVLTIDPMRHEMVYVPTRGAGDPIITRVGR